MNIMKRIALVISEREQRKLLAAFSRETDRLRLTHALEAKLIDKSSEALYFWRRGERKMRLHNARTMRSAIEHMRKLSSSQRAMFVKAAQLEVAERLDWIHFLNLRQKILAA